MVFGIVGVVRERDKAVEIHLSHAAIDSYGEA